MIIHLLLWTAFLVYTYTGKGLNHEVPLLRYDKNYGKSHKKKSFLSTNLIKAKQKK